MAFYVDGFQHSHILAGILLDFYYAQNKRELPVPWVPSSKAVICKQSFDATPPNCRNSILRSTGSANASFKLRRARAFHYSIHSTPVIVSPTRAYTPIMITGFK